MIRNKFKECRLQMELSQAHLAEALGLSPRTVARYESGDSKIPRRVELAINSLRLSTFSESTPTKHLPIIKRLKKKNKPVQAVATILHVASDRQLGSQKKQKNTYTVGFNISLTVSPYLIEHPKAGAVERALAA